MTRAAGAAGDSVDRGRVVRRATWCLAIIFLQVSRRDKTPRNSTACSSYTLHGMTALPFWLALAGHRDCLVSVYVRIRTCRRRSPSLSARCTRWSSASTASTSSIPGCSRSGARVRRHGPVEGRRPARHRRRDGERLGAPGGLVLRRDAPGAERPDLLVRVHDDLRRLRDLRGRQVPGVRATDAAQPRDLGSDPGRPAGARLRRRPQGAAAAHARARRRAGRLPRHDAAVHRLQPAERGHAVRRAAAPGSRASTSTTTSAWTASRCCSSC